MSAPFSRSTAAACGMVNTIGRDRSRAYAESPSTLPIASAARALPAITVMVTAGLSRPYIFRSFGSGETIFCICVEESDVSAASAAPKSARALYGFTIVQSLPLFASWIVLPSCAISTPSDLVVIELQHRLVAQVERRAVEGAVEIRRDQEHALLVRLLRVEISARRPSSRR